MKRLSQHAELLNLIENSGPFLAVSVLDKAFPQGLEKVDTPRRQRLRAAYEEWREAVDQDDGLLPELHQEWIRLVLTELLEFDHESLVQATNWVGKIPSVSSQEHFGRFQPDWIVRSPTDHKLRLFVAVLPPQTDLESVRQNDGWPVSLQERMTLLCRAHGVRLGLLTDGERWMLVNAPVGSISSQTSWYSRLWFQEPITLKAFQSLLGVRRCFGPAEDTLESLLDESLEHHEEVTDTLGEQVRRAVEVLVQCLDKADEDRNRELLRDVASAELYEAGLTVMMRLVFVLCAEERGLLLLGDPVYDQGYAVSTLRGQLTEDSERHGPEVLDRRHDAWARLLAVFRAVYGGIDHESLRMPALGGSLFDPDRFLFLEGRAKDTCWRDTPAAPLPIDNRTVLLLLNSLQILEQSGGALLLSYRALDVEQIGHVYEGLLEHTVARVPRVTLGLHGSQKAKNPNVALAELESARLDSEAAIVKLIQEVTGRSESAIKNGLSSPVDDMVFGRVLGVCGGDTALAERTRPFTNLLRTDAWDDPIVYRDKSFMVTLGSDRRETGTHYTPKSLTESIVTTTLEPVVYIGPAEGRLRKEWKLKSSREILDIKVCDPAMGSGAFLVQACRYLGEKLVEAWLHEEADGRNITVDGESLEQLGTEEPLPSQLDERLTIACRLVAERCLYGVDINPMAVELAKLSIWLVTLAKGRPFGFLDHNLRSGDSLLGIHQLEQLTRLQMNPTTGDHQNHFFEKKIREAVEEAIKLRMQLRAAIIRDINDVAAMTRLNHEARRRLESIELIADAMIGEALRCGGNLRTLDTTLNTLAAIGGDFLNGNEKMGKQIARQSQVNLNVALPKDKPLCNPFHWVFEYPEVFANSKKTGFDAVIGNPPFMFGKNITAKLGKSYNEFLKRKNKRASSNVDICAHFFIRAYELLCQMGSLGLLATSSIAEGQTREAGLDKIICEGGSIYFAKSKIHWPGKAAVYVSAVNIFKGSWRGERHLDGWRVKSISPMLTTQNDWKIHQLKQNRSIAFVGVIPNGEGFFLSDSEYSNLISGNEKNADVLLPYITGSDLNSTNQLKGRYIINFWDWDIEKAGRYPDVLKIVLQRVKPHRQTLSAAKQKVKDTWWLYEASSKALFHAVGNSDLFEKEPKGTKGLLEKAIAIARVSKTGAFTMVPTRCVFAAEVVVIANDNFAIFSVLQSSIHLVFAWNYAGKMKVDLRYSPTMCFEPFPFPEKLTDELRSFGEGYYDKRTSILNKKKIGLTKLYNDVHKRNNAEIDICEFRELHALLDRTVIATYGWSDISLNHDFHEVAYLPENDRVRFTISESARVEVLRRLFELNQQRYKDEVKSTRN